MARVRALVVRALVVALVLALLPGRAGSLVLVVDRTLSIGDRGDDVAVLQAALTSAGWPTWVDGEFGPHTDRTVRNYQRANGLVVDGIAGPQTLGHLGIYPELRGDGCDVAEAALLRAGATAWEASFGRQVAWRESRCALGAVNQSARTRDNSWGPWQINFYGSLYNPRVALLGHPTENTADWLSAAENFLLLGRTSGWCHWDPPDYC